MMSKEKTLALLAEAYDLLSKLGDTIETLKLEDKRLDKLRWSALVDIRHAEEALFELREHNG